MSDIGVSLTNINVGGTVQPVAALHIDWQAENKNPSGDAVVVSSVRNARSLDKSAPVIDPIAGGLNFLPHLKNKIYDARGNFLDPDPNHKGKSVDISK